MMLDTPTIQRYFRRGLLVLLAMVLVGLSVLLAPTVGDKRNSPGQLPARFSQPRRVLAHPSAELDTSADQVYGQPDYESAAAPDPPVAESLNAPASIAVYYYSGQVFVTDTGNHRVLIWDDVDAYEDGDPANVVLGQPDFTSNTPNNGGLSASSLNTPWGLALDDDGNLFVSDAGNNRVVMYEPDVDPDDEDFLVFTDGQAASMVLGQSNFTSNAVSDPPTTASLNHPMGIVLDYYDNLVVADRDNNRVLIFEGPLETGMGAVKVLGQPRDVVGAPLGTFGDFTSNAAPNPPTATSLNHPTGVAIGAGHDELFVADTGNHRVLVYTVDPTDSVADYIIGQPDFTSNTPNNGGVSASSLNSPNGVEVDAGNRLLVADTGNHRVLGYNAPLTSAAANHVFGQDGSFTTNTANKGGVSEDSLNAPVGLSTDEDYMDVYIADQGNNRALEYDVPLENPIPEIIELYPGTVRAGSAAFQLEIWATGIVDGTIVKVNGSVRTAAWDYLGVLIMDVSAADVSAGGELILTLTNPTPGGGVSQPMTFAVYVPQAGNTTADSVMGQAGFTSDWGEFEWVEADTLLGPTDVEVDRSTGRVFVLDRENWRVLSWPSSTALQDGASADLVIGYPDFGEQDWDNPIVSANRLLYPSAIAVDTSGNLYVSDAANYRVLVFRAPLSNGMAASVVIGQPDFTSSTAPSSPTASNLFLPGGVAVDSEGNLYVADTGHHRVLEFDAPLTNGQAASRVLGQGGSFTTGGPNQGDLSADTLYYPMDVAVDAAGNLYVADNANHRVLEYNTPLAGDPTADRVFGQGGSFNTQTPNKGGLSADSLNLPTAVAISADSVLYIADTSNHRVLEYDAPLTGDTTADLVFGQQGSFTTNQMNNGGRSAESLRSPWGIAVDAAGNLYLADSDNNRALVYLKPVTPAAPALHVSKFVDTGGVNQVPLGGTVTYTLVISNGSDSLAANVVLTDPLPSGVAFGAWIQRGSALLPPPVRWGPHDVAAHTAYTLSFSAQVTTNVAFAGQVITNTAHFSASNIAQPGVAEVGFVVEQAAAYSVYLPVVLKQE
ncbi:MAG: DUF11 domain-containing protein [Anaerolineae bacterium]|nr:DUF11 domain-containing protein [Anaerolineae bacterium]